MWCIEVSTRRAHERTHPISAHTMRTHRVRQRLSALLVVVVGLQLMGPCSLCTLSPLLSRAGTPASSSSKLPLVLPGFAHVGPGGGPGREVQARRRPAPAGSVRMPRTPGALQLRPRHAPVAYDNGLAAGNCPRQRTFLSPLVRAEPLFDDDVTCYLVNCRFFLATSMRFQNQFSGMQGKILDSGMQGKEIHTSFVSRY